MSEFDVLLASELEPFVEDLGSRKARMFRDEAKQLGTDPFPESEYGDKQPVPFEEKPWYSMKVGRSWYLFYTVDEDAREVRIVDVIPFETVMDRDLR